MGNNFNTTPAGEAAAGNRRSRAAAAGLWIARLVTAGVLGMVSYAKLFNFTETGSKPLAEGLGVSRGMVAGIGLVEAIALVLILLPRTRALGALLAAGTVLGALFSHATVLGWSGNPAAEMWPLALLVLVASSICAVAWRREIPVIGRRL